VKKTGGRKGGGRKEALKGRKREGTMHRKEKRK